MRIELRYFTGTGNSLKIMKTCKEVFDRFNHEISVSEITCEELKINESDLLGFCFPGYAFGIPRICRRYLKSINQFKSPQKVFVLITAGDSDESGFSLKEKKPVWSSGCEQCMRCVNFCPNESIYQTMGGDTKGKNRYFEPGFKPKIR
jgi:hypothetical protein